MKIKNVIKFIILSCLIVSCGPPEQYEKGMVFYNTQKYDSAMYYFDRLLPADDEWLDSAKIMKSLCLKKMIVDHDWSLYNAQLDIYGRDTALMNKGNNFLKEELISMIRKDSTKAFYKVYDTYKDRFSSTVMSYAMNTHIDSFLSTNIWNGGTSLKGQRLKFERNKENIINAVSDKSLNGWNKNMTIYKDITYDKEGVFKMSPRVFQGYYGSYFGKGGSVVFKGKDSVKINYGRALRNEIRYFIRGDKVKMEDKKENPQ